MNTLNQTKQNEKSNVPKGSKLTIFPLSNASFVKNAMDCCYHMLESKGLEPPGKRLKSVNNGTDQGNKTEDVNHFGFFTNQEEAVDLFNKEGILINCLTLRCFDFLTKNTIFN